MPKFIFVIVCCFYSALLSAQKPRQYTFTHYTTESGLLSNQVNTAVQDEDGYIWTGTTDGLQRFDGIRYKTFQHSEKDSFSIPSNPVWELMMDKRKNLWILMADGRVGIFDTKKFTFHERQVKFRKPVSPNTFLKHLRTDEYGHLFYLISGTEVITLNEGINEFSYKNDFFKQKDEWGIVDFIQQPGTQKYWMSIQNGGIAIYNKATGNLSYPGDNRENEMAIDQFKSLTNSIHFYFDKHGRFWFINHHEDVPLIYCYDLRKNLVIVDKASLTEYIKGYHEINGFFEQEDGSIWIKGNPVFAKYLETERKFQLVLNGYKNEQSIAYEKVACLYEDHEMNVWVCTDNNGLYRFNPAMEYFTNIKHVNHVNSLTGAGNPTSFAETRRGTVLAGTWGDGLYEYDKNFNPVPLNISGLETAMDPFVWSMCASRDSDNIWVSTQHGIYLIDQSNRSFKWHNPSILKGSVIKQMAEDKNGGLWLGMFDTGVFKWNPLKGKKNFNEGIEAISDIPPVMVNKITVDSKGYVWIGTPENGLYVIDPVFDKLAIRFSDTSSGEKKLPERGISSILEYNDSLMIITTATRIVIYNRLLNKLRVIGSPGMISGFITAVEKDRNGYLWLTSTSGLYRVNIQKQILIKFDRRDGIDNEHFIQSASAVLADGRLLFGTRSDIVMFDPEKISIVWPMPLIHITDFKVMGKSQSVDSLTRLKEIELGFQDNSLAIEFSPLIYNNPYLIKYKLEGLEKSWRIADRNNEAIYSFLPPGHYTFLIKEVDEEGNESAKTGQLKISILAPFWKTWWFYGLLALAAASLLFWLDRERTKKKEAVQKIRSNIAEDLYEDVNTALRNINILSEIAQLKADKDPERSKDFIQQINSKSQQMIIAMDDMLWGISPENDSMQKTIDRLEEHIDFLRNSNQVQIDLLVDKKVRDLNLNMRLRQNIFWFLKNGSANIVKTGAINCKIHIAFEKSHLIYTLEFDATRSDMQQLTNILGRQELANKLYEIKGKLTVQTHTTMSVIQLSIPV